MGDLKIGDRILVGKGVYEPIFSFGHHAAHVQAEMLEIVTPEHNLILTNTHMIFTAQHGPIPASLVHVGDRLLLENGTAEVESIKLVKEHGMYAPFTPSGRLIVDGVLVSSYASLEKSKDVQFFLGWGISHHTLSHIVEAPHRILCYHFGGCREEAYNEDGINFALIKIMYFGRWVLKLRGMPKFIMMSIVLLVASMFMLLEVLISYPLLGLFVLFSFIKKRHNCNGHKLFVVGSEFQCSY
jgi:hypothetical protein